jgi:hypothetical protein
MNGANEGVQAARSPAQERLEPEVNAEGKPARGEKYGQCDAPPGESAYVRNDGLRGWQEGGEGGGDIDRGHPTNISCVRL